MRVWSSQPISSHKPKNAPDPDDLARRLLDRLHDRPARRAGPATRSRARSSIPPGARARRTRPPPAPPARPRRRAPRRARAGPGPRRSTRSSGAPRRRAAGPRTSARPTARRSSARRAAARARARHAARSARPAAAGARAPAGARSSAEAFAAAAGRLARGRPSGPSHDVRTRRMSGEGASTASAPLIDTRTSGSLGAGSVGTPSPRAAACRATRSAASIVLASPEVARALPQALELRPRRPPRGDRARRPPRARGARRAPRRAGSAHRPWPRRRRAPSRTRAAAARPASDASAARDVGLARRRPPTPPAPRRAGHRVDSMACCQPRRVTPRPGRRRSRRRTRP